MESDSSTSRPRIAVAPPGLRDYLNESIRSAGGEPSELADADALIWTDPRDPSGLGDALRVNPDLAWIQLPFAGVEPMIHLMDSSRIWTSAKGAYGAEVAEHALGLALAGLRHIASFSRLEEWTRPSGSSLFRREVTIIGAGGITTSLVSLLEPFGCTVNVLRRQDQPFPGADFTGTIIDMPEVLPRTEVLFLTLALTPDTRGVIDAAALDLLPSTAWIVNVARGGHIVTDDLVAALDNGSIAGAALDVTDPEPLPDGHPLWSMDNCIITPHSANTPEMAAPTFTRRVIENIGRFVRGEDLLGVVDLDAGF